MLKSHDKVVSRPDPNFGIWQGFLYSLADIQYTVDVLVCQRLAAEN